MKTGLVFSEEGLVTQIEHAMNKRMPADTSIANRFISIRDLAVTFAKQNIGNGMPRGEAIDYAIDQAAMLIAEEGVDFDADVMYPPATPKEAAIVAGVLIAFIAVIVLVAFVFKL